MGALKTFPIAPIYLYISGGGGAGKSHLSQLTRQL